MNLIISQKYKKKRNYLGQGFRDKKGGNLLEVETNF
jgi:hypothetical protein